MLPPILLRAAPGLATGAALSIERGVALVLLGVLLDYAARVLAAFEADLAGAPMRTALRGGMLLAAGMLIALPISGGRCVAGIAAVALVAVAELGVGALGMWLAWISLVSNGVWLRWGSVRRAGAQGE